MYSSRILTRVEVNNANIISFTLSELLLYRIWGRDQAQENDDFFLLVGVTKAN